MLTHLPSHMYLKLSFPFFLCKLMANTSKKLVSLFTYFLCLLGLSHYCSSQKTCPPCGPIQVPYPLSTNRNCGDIDYTLRCDPGSKKLYFDALNGTTYVVLRIMAQLQRLVVRPSPWLPGKCVTRDMEVGEGLWLNQSLPFNITSSNTIFLLNCSPRLLVSPLNCTPSSLCHRYLESSGHVDSKRAFQCASDLDPCCTFIAGGMPSAYKIRLHSSGCRAFRSILHLDLEKPANLWEEGLEIQWAPPQEPICKTQQDCSGASKCSPAGNSGVFRCICNRGYQWDHSLGTCLRKKRSAKVGLSLKVSIGVISFFSLALVMTLVRVRKSCRLSSKRTKLAKAREEMLECHGGKSAKVFNLKEVKKATNGFSKDRILGSGAFGEVYRGELQDGTIVAVKSAKVGNIKSTEQVLNEVGILSQVNHKNLVKLLGCCIYSEQPLMIYEYVPNGTLHANLQGKYPAFLDWKTRLRIALQTAEALTYLHSSAHTPIYHRDVKSTNILLDNYMNAKVADFGLSRLASPGLSHVTTCAQGTLGYLDPEYYRNYQLTDKSDVYSYGVVLLELLTSQKAIDFSRDQDDVNLATYVRGRAKSDAILEIVDQRLMQMEKPSSSDVLTSLKLFLDLALSCLREKREDRPTMKEVVQELQRIIQIVNQESV